MIPFLLGAVGLALGGAAITVVSPETAAAIRDLGHPDYVVRETACRTLIDVGPAALPALQRAQADPVPEVAERAAALVTTLTTRADTERLLQAKLYDAAFDESGLIATTEAFNRLVGKVVPTDARVLPSQAKLTLKGSRPFWSIVGAVESTFGLTYGFTAGGSAVWMPKDERVRFQDKPTAFRLTATALPERLTAGAVPLLFTLQPDAERTAVRVESIRLEEVVDPLGRTMTVRPALVAPPPVDFTTTRFVRGGRIVVGANGLELLPDPALPLLTQILTQQQIAVPIVRSDDCDRIETIAGTLRAQVRGLPVELLRLTNVGGGSATASGRGVMLKIGKAKPDGATDLGLFVTVSYATNLIAFAENPAMPSPENEVILLNGRARMIVRGQAGNPFGDPRLAGVKSVSAAHGLKLFSAEATAVPFRVESSSLNFAGEGTILEQFTIRLTGGDLAKFGTPATATLTAKPTRTITIPFRLNAVPKLSPPLPSGTPP